MSYNADNTAKTKHFQKYLLHFIGEALMGHISDHASRFLGDSFQLHRSFYFGSYVWRPRQLIHFVLVPNSLFTVTRMDPKSFSIPSFRELKG